MEYPKINSLWKRQGWYFEQDKKNSLDYQQGRQSFIEGDYAEEAFGNIRLWDVEEKVDGTNIRLHFSKKEGQLLSPSILGRTSAAQIPPHLLSYLQTIATWDLFFQAFPALHERPDFDVWIFGEGYGPKIQSCGGNYRSDPGFILFDVWCQGWWLQRDVLPDIAAYFGVSVVPRLGVMEEKDIVELVKSKPLSQCSRLPQMMEGVIARASPLVLFRSGKPVMFKLKCKEF